MDQKSITVIWSRKKLSNQFLNSFKDCAVTKHSGRLFQMSAVLIEKKFDLTQVVAWGLKSLNIFRVCVSNLQCNFIVW